MNIVILRLNTSDFGKIGTYNVQEVGLAKALLKQGHIVTVLYLHRQVKSIMKDEVYDFVYYLPHKSIGLHGIFETRLLESFKLNYLILFSDNQFWSKNIINWCKKRSITCVNYFGGVLSNNKHFLNQLYTKLILIRNRKSYKNSINIAKTNAVKDEMKKHRIFCDKVISVGLDLDIMSSKKSIDYDLRQELGYKKDDKIVLFVGRLVDYKNPLFACKIINHLSQIDQNYKLIIIGEGILKTSILSYISENKLENNINYIGRINYQDIYKYMVISNCFINLSPIEIFGMAIVEAMYYGLPTIAHTAPGPNDIITNEKDGYLVDSFDESEWEAIIKKVCEHKNEALIINSKKTVVEKFTWDAVCRDFICEESI